MKYYTFFPGFLVVALIAVLLFINVVFKVEVPIVKNFKNPLLVLVIVGFMMCAFGTLGDSFSKMFSSGNIDPFVITMIVSGILLITISIWGLFGKTAVFGILQGQQIFYAISGLIVFKIIIATVRLVVRY